MSKELFELVPENEVENFETNADIPEDWIGTNIGWLRPVTTPAPDSQRDVLKLNKGGIEYKLMEIFSRVQKNQDIKDCYRFIKSLMQGKYPEYAVIDEDASLSASGLEREKVEEVLRQMCMQIVGYDAMSGGTASDFFPDYEPIITNALKQLGYGERPNNTKA